MEALRSPIIPNVFTYKGSRVIIETYPKGGGEHAWAFSIDGGAFIGLERARADSKMKAMITAERAAKTVIEGHKLQSHLQSLGRRADTPLRLPCCQWCRADGSQDEGAYLLTTNLIARLTQ